MSNQKSLSVDMSFGSGKGYNPVSELMRAIILRAIEDLNCHGELRDDAMAFFNGDDDDQDDEYIFSFAAICKHFGFDPEKTRHSIIHADHRISTRRRAA